ncbi:hypothetical protein ACFV1N_04880 [Streptosporangium canum]|uniref:hypothetical protein n=1 Tax=Streptosporangium canum TaxID=324952 RepID=UPI003699A102
MNVDQFPTDQNRIIAALERRIADLEALVRQTKGTPILQASGPFFLPNSTPAAQSGGAVVYGSGGDFRVITSGGVIKQIPGQGVAVPNPPSQTASPLPGGSTVNGAQYNLMGADVDAIWDSHVALLNSLRGAVYIAT